MVRDVCLQEVEPDGIVFDPNSIRGQVITEDADYEGVRVNFRGSLDNARLSIQLDIGFGDIVIPSPELMAYPTILDLPAPQIRGYSRESTIAEKFETMVRRGIMNSRMKDFWDIRLLSRQFDFDGQDPGGGNYRNIYCPPHGRPCPQDGKPDPDRAAS